MCIARQSQRSQRGCHTLTANHSMRLHVCILGYVALSRVRTANDILILQPFSKDVFQQGVNENPDILMGYLRGEDVDELLRPRRDAEAQVFSRLCRVSSRHVSLFWEDLQTQTPASVCV